jgi:hypothetical protein
MAYCRFLLLLKLAAAHQELGIASVSVAQNLSLESLSLEAGNRVLPVITICLEVIGQLRLLRE